MRDVLVIRRWSCCPRTHWHTSDRDAAHCTALDSIFGPIHAPLKKRPALCVWPGCDEKRERGGGKRKRMVYCRAHRLQYGREYNQGRESRAMA